MTEANSTNSTEYKEAIQNRKQYFEIYTILLAAGLVFFIIKGLFSFHFCLNAARKLHEATVHAMLHCYMKFFDTHFIGNIINRLSKDFYTIDEYIPFLLYDCSRSFFSSVGVIVLLATVSWGFVVLTVLLFFTLFLLLRFYLPTGRSLRRLEAATRSPVIGYLNSTLEGLQIIRSADQQDKVQAEFDRHQDLYTSAYYMNQTTSRLFAFLIDILGSLFIFGITFKFIIFPQDNYAGDVGMSISQAMALSGVLQWVFKQIADIETVMTAVERVMEYANAETETKAGSEIQIWPTLGNINFSDVFLSYQNELVLKDLSFKISGGEKVAIIGRTGAGKSSIISLLFRLYNYEGDILIDQQNIKDISLESLRSAITIIPQEPLLFSGTIRENIDPYEKFTDQEIGNALKKAHIDHLISDLNNSVNSYSFSAGQKQLFCLARSIINKHKIIILDEATANLDNKISELVDLTIEESFQDCTVLFISHKLEVLKSCNKVLVINDGELVEFEAPEKLLKNQKSF